MPSTSHHESARIYRFVPRARTTPPVLRHESATVTDLVPQRYATVEFGSGWYHEAAIREEAERGRRP